MLPEQLKHDYDISAQIEELVEAVNALISHLEEKEKGTAFDIEVKRSEDCRKKVWDAEQRRTMDELSQHATDSSPQKWKPEEKCGNHLWDDENDGYGSKQRCHYCGLLRYI